MIKIRGFTGSRLFRGVGDIKIIPSHFTQGWTIIETNNSMIYHRDRVGLRPRDY